MFHLYSNCHARHVLIQSQIQLHSYQAVKFNEIHSNRLNLKSNLKKQKSHLPSEGDGLTLGRLSGGLRWGGG
jgi:hypothetical protein